MSAEPITPASTSPGSTPPGTLGRARCLVASNALDAAGRSGTDVAVDVLAVLALGVGAEQMGVLMTLSGLGFLVLGVPLGVMVDRHLHPGLLGATGLAKAVLLSTVVAAWALNALTFTHLAVVMTALGVLTVLAETAQAAMVPRVVPSALVSRLAARLESADAALGLMVPAGAGVLVSALGAGPVLGMAAIFLVGAGVLALKVRLRPALSAPEATKDDDGPAIAAVVSRGARFWNDVSRGWTVLRRTPVLWLLTLSSLAGNIGLALFAPVEAVWVLSDLQLGPAFVGLQVTAGALGALVVSALAPRAIDALGEGGCVLLGAAGCALAVGLHVAAFMERAHAGPLLLAGAALWGSMVVLGNLANGAVFVRSCPEGTLGRATALRRTLTRGSVPLATLAGGALGAALGIGVALAAWQVMAVLALVIAVPVARHPSRA